MNNIGERNNEKCCGCGVCAAVCPSSAIRMAVNEDGYYKAIVSNDCTDCGKCIASCYKFWEIHDEPFPKARHSYSGKNKNDHIRIPSSSGGIGTALVETALGLGYQAIGAELDLRDMRLKSIIITEKDECPRIRGSKYIPCNTVNAFQKISELEKVAVIGTPCQIAGLRKAFGQVHKDLLLIDFRCSGPSGLKLFDKYIQYLNSFNNHEIKSINMRDKTTSWHIWGVKTVFSNGKEYYKDNFHDFFGKCFNFWNARCQNCLDCNVLKNHSLADIRVEDAWQLIDKASKQDYKKGFSQITVFTEKGEAFLKQAESKLDLDEIPISYVENHKISVYKEPSELMAMLRDDSLDLKKIVSLYNKKQTLSYRFFLWLGHLVSINRIVYSFSRSLYYFLKPRKS